MSVGNYLYQPTSNSIYYLLMINTNFTDPKVPKAYLIISMIGLPLVI